VRVKLARQGIVVVISAPSGGGKSTVIREILRKGDPRYRYSISVTTRAMREDEVDGDDYIFVSEEEFHRKIQSQDFVEWAIVHGNYYGTSKEGIDAFLDEGKIILLDIDVQGGLEIKRLYKDRALLIFIMPPNLQELENRLRSRQTEREDEITRRLAAVPAEIGNSSQYDKIVINENLEKTISDVIEIVEEKYNA
jgi:guanylate kinase